MPVILDKSRRDLEKVWTASRWKGNAKNTRSRRSITSRFRSRNLTIDQDAILTVNDLHSWSVLPPDPRSQEINVVLTLDRSCFHCPRRDPALFWQNRFPSSTSASHAIYDTPSVGCITTRLLPFIIAFKKFYDAKRPY